MTWRVCRTTADIQFAFLVLSICMLTGLICLHEPGFAATPVEQRHAASGAGIDGETKTAWQGRDHDARLVARLRAPVMANDENRRGEPSYLRRAQVFLAARDFRRALDACLFHLWEQPSVESYVYLTYVYHAIDGYMEHLAARDRWVGVEHLFLNLAARGANDLIDPPDVLARMAKEIMHNALQKQADVTSAMAARLDRETVNHLWKQQSAWRAAHPDDWWASAPDAWGW